LVTESTAPERPVGRAQRADAVRNRERLLEVALRVLSENGDAPLDAIARAAGVGSGTLYRHFPTRESLIEAVYQNELTVLCESAEQLLATQPPGDALRAWLHGFLDYATTKRGLADALRAVIATGANPFEHSRARILASLGMLLTAAANAGAVRADVEPFDVLTSVSGFALASSDPAQHERLLDLLLAGLAPVS
jgi:AcrR family transcriptional regulator